MSTTRGLKILYVEDELASNVDRIKLLFKLYISEEESNSITQDKNPHNGEKQKLTFSTDGLRDDFSKSNNRSYNPIKNDYIKKVFEKNPILDITDNLLEALELINKNEPEYGLYIIDRNLSTIIPEKSIDKITEFWPEIDQCKLKTNVEENRHGDLILGFLLNKKSQHIKCKEFFYFLTAHDNETKELSELIKNYDLGEAFSKEKIIEKANNEKAQKLKGIIDSFENAYIISLYPNVFKIFELSDEIFKLEQKKSLIDALLYSLNRKDECDPHKLRIILMSIYKHLHDKNCIPFRTPKLKYPLILNNGGLNINNVTDFLFDNKSNYGKVNNSIAKALFAIGSFIGKDCDKNKQDGSMQNRHRLSILTFCTCEILVWFGKIVKNNYSDLKQDTTYTEKENNKYKINRLISYLKKDNDGWMSIGILNQLEHGCYIPEELKFKDFLCNLGYETCGNKFKAKEKDNIV